MTAVFYDRDILLSKFNISGQQAKPSAVILCYPVISALHSPHLGSFINLSGSNNFKEHISYSAELAVSADTPPSFIWHTAQDNAVGVQNSLLRQILRSAACLLKCIYLKKDLTAFQCAIILQAKTIRKWKTPTPQNGLRCV